MANVDLVFDTGALEGKPRPLRQTGISHHRSDRPAVTAPPYAACAHDIENMLRIRCATVDVKTSEDGPDCSNG